MHRRKPILFHDIDGVLYGTYGGCFQLRPNVKPWLEWASEHFEVVWLTTWDEEKIKTLLSVVGAEKFWKDLPRPQTLRRPAWEQRQSKAKWIAATGSLKGQPWVWIDDDLPTLEELQALGIDPARCLAVDPKGPDALVMIQAQCTEMLEGICEESSVRLF